MPNPDVHLESPWDGPPPPSPVRSLVQTSLDQAGIVLPPVGSYTVRRMLPSEPDWVIQARPPLGPLSVCYPGAMYRVDVADLLGMTRATVDLISRNKNTVAGLARRAQIAATIQLVLRRAPSDPLERRIFMARVDTVLREQLTHDEKARLLNATTAAFGPPIGIEFTAELVTALPQRAASPAREF